MNGDLSVANEATKNFKIRRISVIREEHNPVDLRNKIGDNLSMRFIVSGKASTRAVKWIVRKTKLERAGPDCKEINSVAGINPDYS